MVEATSDSDTDDKDTGGRTSSRRGWRLIARLTRERRAGIALGVAVGLAWTAAKVSTGLIVRTAVDRGIVADDTDVTALPLEAWRSLAPALLAG